MTAQLGELEKMPRFERAEWIWNLAVQLIPAKSILQSQEQIPAEYWVSPQGLRIRELERRGAMGTLSGAEKVELLTFVGGQNNASIRIGAALREFGLVHYATPEVMASFVGDVVFQTQAMANPEMARRLVVTAFATKHARGETPVFLFANPELWVRAVPREVLLPKGTSAPKKKMAPTPTLDERAEMRTRCGRPLTPLGSFGQPQIFASEGDPEAVGPRFPRPPTEDGRATPRREPETQRRSENAEPQRTGEADER
jgi:hypothetical protein